MFAFRHLAGLAAVAVVFLWAPAAQANHSFPATYSGTHQQGGTVEFDVNADGTAITRIRTTGLSGTFPGGTCQFGESTSTGNLPINNHAFSLGSPGSGFEFSGSFPSPQMAQGQVRIRTFGQPSCDSGYVPWTASTSAPPPGPPPGPPPPPPPPAGDTTPPTVGVSAPRSQRLGRGRIRVRVSCPSEGCRAAVRGTVSFPGAAATFRLKGDSVTIAQGDSERATLVLPRRALAAVKRALARGRRVTARISVRARDQAGNEATLVRRSVRLRR